MMNATFFSDILVSSLARHSPALLLYLAAIIVAIIFFKRATPSAILIIIGSCLLTFSVINDTVIQYIILSADSPFDVKHLSMLMGIMGSILSLAGCLCWLIAIFTGRKTQATT